MKCSTSALAKTIHLIVSPIIEERPLSMCSAFSDRLLTDKRREKSKNILPPIQFDRDVTRGPIIDLPLPFLRKSSRSSEESSTSFRQSFRKIFRRFRRDETAMKRLEEIFDESILSARSLSKIIEQENVSSMIVENQTELISNSYLQMGLTNEQLFTAEQKTLNDEKNQEEIAATIDTGTNSKNIFNDLERFIDQVFQQTNLFL